MKTWPTRDEKRKEIRIIDNVRKMNKTGIERVKTRGKKDEQKG